MYHRICDFFNLYMSLLFNRSFDFNTDILIVSWNWVSFIDWDLDQKFKKFSNISRSVKFYNQTQPKFFIRNTVSS